jgi:surface protein
MQGMFTAATNFNQNISSWNVSNVTTFGSANLGMFRLATNFNQNIGGWNVGSATSFRDMFSSATNFNQNIGSWNVGLGTDFTNFMAGKTNLNYSEANLDAIYNEWTNRSLQTGRTITFNTIKRTASSTPARDLLTRTNTTVSISNAVNNGSGLIRITSAAHGRTTGEKIFISGVLGTTEANGGWIVTVIDATTLDLQGSTFTNTYTSGGTLRTGYGWSVTDGGI